MAGISKENGVTPKSGSTALLRKCAEGESLGDQFGAFYEDIAGIKDSLNGGDTTASSIAISCDCVLKSKELGELEAATYIDYNNVRDKATPIQILPREN